MIDVLDKITKMRNQKGWTSYKLAKKAGIPQSTISTWYAKGRAPTIVDLEKICDALNISLAEFFKEESKGTKFSKRRKKMGISLKKLSEVTGMDIELLQAYESGKKDISSEQFRVVKKLADVLLCTTEDIVD